MMNMKIRKSKRKTTGIIIIFIALFFSSPLFAQQPETGERTISLSADSIKPLKIGQTIPDVALATTENKTFRLKDYVKNQPVVLIFYRGGWCPYCNVHLKELMDTEAELRKLGFNILAVSPDTPENLSKTEDKHKLKYTLLSDTSVNGAASFGVAFQVDEPTLKRYDTYGIDLEKASGEQHHILPVPSVFIIDKNAVVKYVYYNSNYKQQLKKEEVIQAAKEVRKANQK